MHIRLTRKLANHLDGVDVTDVNEGDVIDLPRLEAQLLIAERWAEPFVPPLAHVAHANLLRRSTDKPLDPHVPHPIELLYGVRRRSGERRNKPSERSVEDLIREEFQDSRARIIRGGFLLSMVQESDV